MLTSVRAGVLCAMVIAGACRRVGGPRPCARDGALPPRDPLAGVVDPWRFAHARGASPEERAHEDIGPFEPVDPADPRSAVASPNGHHWTALVDLAWDRDVSIAFDREPVDLDGDGAPDARLTRWIEAPGGLLAHPERFGLLPTPDDPRGRKGRISASTGVLGLREALDPAGRPTGLIGMTCWLCHAGRNPADGEMVLGLPNTGLDYGLLLATSSLLDDDRVLDWDRDGSPDTPAEVARRSPFAADRALDRDGDGRVTAGEYRSALGFPPGRAVRARLLFSGPGRQDLTGEFGLDLGVPGLHSARYPGTRGLRQEAQGVTNPVSVPPILATAGLALQNWSGSEVAEEPYLERLAGLVGEPEPALLAHFGLPTSDRALARRALLLDLRNLGTLGLQQDSFPGLLFADMLRGRAAPHAEAARTIPELYALREVRAALAVAEARLRRPVRDPERVARGRAIFTERVIGEIANRQILKRVPPQFAAARLAPPLVAPIDPGRSIAARLPVRCADCHNAVPLDRVIDLPPNTALPPLGRCTHCHLGHPAQAVAEAARAASSSPREEVAVCVACHGRHRDFGPLAYSSGWLLPFDADGDGNAQGDEADDARAGGIGTEALLSFDVPLAERPEGRFGVELPLLPDPRRAGRVASVVTGVAWVRVAPLVAVFATAPYLHNGSVPTLRALLEPARQRPASFRRGEGTGTFLFDTRLPGNRNFGHEFGTRLGAREKDDVVAFLESL